MYSICNKKAGFQMFVMNDASIIHQGSLRLRQRFVTSRHMTLKCIGMSLDVTVML